MQKELDGIKGSQDSVKKEVDSLKQQLKECQDKSGGNMKQKVGVDGGWFRMLRSKFRVLSMLGSSGAARSAGEPGIRCCQPLMPTRMALLQLADAKAKLDEASKHLSEINT